MTQGGLNTHLIEDMVNLFCLDNLMFRQNLDSTERLREHFSIEGLVNLDLIRTAFIFSGAITVPDLLG